VVVKRLAALRDRAAEGCGAMVLLAGESGVGKTRVAMEVTRVEPSWRMHVIAGEASALSAESAAGVGPAPLHILRPVLQAVADRCQEAGEQATERLLGERRSVLALYEPLLAQVPAARGSLPPPMPLAVEASRQRLFKYLAETIAAFAEEQPVLWVIDDVGWADELSLAFLKSLTREYLETTPVFILATYRSEEATDAVTALVGLPHVRHLVLPRLPQNAVSSMIADMLALRAPKEGFVEFVGQQAEGNPFFVAEYLRTAVTERVLYRDENHAWQLGGEGRAGAEEEYRSLPLPGSLRELIEQRLRRLSPAALKAGLAAAVLGREADFDLVTEVAALSEDVAVDAADELVRRQVVEQGGDGRVRFAHDKLREVAYARAPTEQVVGLHARAAAALEERWTERPDVSRQWATLGHHFAAAKMSEPAARYLKLAADHARAIFANVEAAKLYGEAIKQVNHLLLSLSGAAPTWTTTLLELQESLADLHALAGRRSEARADYELCLTQTAPEQPSRRARLHRKIGKTWEVDHDDQNALRYYALALQELSSDAESTSQQEREEFIQILLEQVYSHYFLKQLPQMNQLIEMARPMVVAHGSARQRVRLLQSQMMAAMLRTRYVTTEETILFARSAFEIASEHRVLSELPMAHFGYGFALLFQNSLDSAARELQAAAKLAERGGDTAVLSRCLTYLTVAARMQHRLEDADALTVRHEKLAAQIGTNEYLGAAQGNRAWLALKQGDPESSAKHSEAALETWGRITLVFPFQWTALIPRLEVAVRAGDIKRALFCAERLLDRKQHALPGAASDALSMAVRLWNDGSHERTSQLLGVALRRIAATQYG
jgi:predicted ATPase